MKRAILSVLIGLCLSITALAQDTTQADPMQAWMEAGMPGEHHKRLESMTGHWDLSSRFRMDPAAEWETSTSEAEIEWVLDGRFLKQEVEDDGTGMSDRPFKGLSFLGYDNAAEEYVTLWMDNHSTMMMMARGTADESGVITFTGTYTDPISKTEKEYTWIYRPVENGYKMEMYEPGPDGKSFLSGELTYAH